MRRDIKKSFWVNSEEDYEIKMKAQAACLSEAEFFRQLCRGYTPVSKPDERFWQAMDLIRDDCNSMSFADIGKTGKRLAELLADGRLQ